MRRSGFALVDVIAATFILLILIPPLLGIFGAMDRFNSYSHQDSKAIQVMDSLVSQIMSEEINPLDIHHTQTEGYLISVQQDPTEQANIQRLTLILQEEGQEVHRTAMYWRHYE